MALTQQDKEEMYQYLITRGKSLGSLDEGDSNLSNKYLAPVLEYSGGTASKAVRLAVSLLQGDKGDKGDIGLTGPTPVMEIGTVTTIEPGTPASVTITENGTDQTTGAKKYRLNLSLPKGAIGNKGDKGVTGDIGPTPILEFGQVITLEPSETASATFEENGTDQTTGAKKYLLTLSIPKGMKGADGTGSGNVLVEAASLSASKQYAFKPGQDGSASGSFVEIEIPDIKVTKESIENVLTGNVTTHTHDRKMVVVEMPTDIWDGTTISTALSGSGTKEDPYLVESCADWLHLNINGSRYGSTTGGDMEKMEKFVKITKNLDFGNHEYSYPVLSDDFSDSASVNARMILTDIDGQGAIFKNINFKARSILLFPLFCSIHDINIESSTFTVDVTGMADTSNIGIYPFSGYYMYFFYNFPYNCSCKATFKTVGSLAEGVTQVGVLVVGIANCIDINTKKAGSYFGDNRFVNEIDVSNALVIFRYVPIYAEPSITSGIPRVYDTSVTGVMPEDGQTAGFFSCMNDMGTVPVYYNSDTVESVAYLGEEGGSSVFVPQTTAELKSPEFLTLLNNNSNAFVADTKNENNGYPVLAPIEQVVYDGYMTNNAFNKKVAELTKKNIISIADVVGDSNKTYSSEGVQRVLEPIGGLDRAVELLSNNEQIIVQVADQANSNTGMSLKSLSQAVFAVDTSDLKAAGFWINVLFGDAWIMFGFNKITNKYFFEDAIVDRLGTVTIGSDSIAGKIKIDDVEIAPGESVKRAPGEIFTITKVTGANVSFSQISGYSNVPHGDSINVVILSDSSLIAVKASANDPTLFEVTGSSLRAVRLIN